MPADNRRGRAALLWLGLIGAAIAALVVVTPSVFRANGDNAYIALALTVGLLALAASAVADRAPVRYALWIIVAVAIALRLFLLFTEPLLSSDIYRYVWDGKVQAHSINPYRYFPAEAPLNALRDTAVFPHINRAEYAVTAYPPVAQMFFFLATRVGETVTTMKAALLACEAVTVTIILLLMRRLRLRTTGVVAYLWHPLPLWEIANNGHIDALMTALLMAGVWLALTGRNTLGALLAGLSGLAKPISLVSLPAFWRPWDWRAPFAVIAGMMICYLPYLSAGWGVLGFVTQGYLSEESYTRGGNIWPLIMWRLAAGEGRLEYPVYIGLVALIMAFFAWRAFSRKSVEPAVMLADIKHLLLAFLLLMSPNYPWYFLVMTPFVVLSGGATMWTVTIGALLLHEEVGWDFFIPIEGRKTAFYGAVVAACAFSWWRERQKARSGIHERAAAP